MTTFPNKLSIKYSPLVSYYHSKKKFYYNADISSL